MVKRDCRYATMVGPAISENYLDRPPHVCYSNHSQPLARGCVSLHPVPVDGGPNYAGFGLNARFDTTVEQIRRNYTTTVSQMRCPYHHKDAWVEVEDGRFNTFHIDIVTCCEEFEQRVRKSLMDPR
jgi:hypothetical protein